MKTLRLLRSWRALSRYATRSLSLLILLACAAGPYDYNELLSYFLPESSENIPQDRRYHFTSQWLYVQPYDDTLDVAQTENAKAWAEYTRNQVTAAETQASLYGSSKRLSSYLSRLNKPAAAYLAFALEAQAANPEAESWMLEADTTQAQPDVASLLKRAQEGYASTNDGFLKERYAFQAVKLAMLGGEATTARSLYDKLVKPLARKTFISDWSLCRKAGADMALGDTARAFYEFAQVFDRCPSRRREADLSVRIYQLRLREKALDVCQNNSEKAAVYALAAIQPNQDGLDLAQKIAEIQPNNALLELIVAREINKNEFYFFTENPTDVFYEIDSTTAATRKEEAPSYFKKLRDFTLRCADNQAMKNPAFWLTATAYLDYLNKDYTSANEALQKAKQQPITNTALRQQMTLQEMLLTVAEAEQISPELEAKVMPLLEQFASSDQFRVNNCFVLACQRMADLYRGKYASTQASGGWWSSCGKKPVASITDVAQAKAFLCTMLTTNQLNRNEAYFAANADQYAIEDTTSAATIQKVIAYFSQANPTDFDRRLQKLCGFDNDYLYTVLGRRALNEHDFAKAAEAFEKVNPKRWEEEPFSSYLDENPFVLITKEGQQPADERVTPTAFAQQMSALSQKVKANPQDAESLYTLGCGSYNMSYFGNAWILVRRQWSGTELDFFGFGDGEPSPTQNDYYTTRKAWTYFEQAMKAAKDPELAARACFMAARCERNAFYAYVGDQKRQNTEWYSDNTFDTRMASVKQAEFSKFFNLLRSRYQATAFQREILQECAYYADYIRQ